MYRELLILALIWSVPAVATATATSQTGDFRRDAQSIETIVNRDYAYLDRFPGAVMPLTDKLRAEAAAVTDRRSLLRYAERALLVLADHHAITGSSLADSWAVVPSHSDLWIERQGAALVITAVRAGSPSAAAGVMPGDRLRGIDGLPATRAIAAFLADLGLEDSDERAGFAARILAAGRRDRTRSLSIEHGNGPVRELVLPNLYMRRPDRPPLIATATTICFNDSLGEDATIAAFDAAMRRIPSKSPVTIDLRDTPSGGNTVIARAVMGWFVTRATGYQIHNDPSEQRRTGIARQWIEQVLPRAGKYHAGPLTVRVGRWTGSMGEGLAIGLRAIKARITGGPMAGLRGAVSDINLAHSGITLKLPTERLMTVDGIPRELFLAPPDGGNAPRRPDSAAGR